MNKIRIYWTYIGYIGKVRIYCIAQVNKNIGLLGCTPEANEIRNQLYFIEKKKEKEKGLKITDSGEIKIIDNISYKNKFSNKYFNP